MKKPYLLSLLFSMICLVSSAQKIQPVSWTFDVAQNEDATYTFTATAKIDKDWAVYSQFTEEGGPVPLSFTFESNEELIGKTEEKSQVIKQHSKLFDIQVSKFKKEAVFTQVFKPNAGQKSISGYLNFMCCDDKVCLPPTDVEFDVAL